MPTMPKEYSRSKQREHRAKQSLLKGGLLPFQKRFVDALTRKQGAPEIGILCSPRAQGKSWLCGRLIGRSLTPGDDLHESSVENVLVASSRSQAAITLEFARQALADVPGIRWSNDGAIHVASRARIKIISSDARRSLGLGAHSRMLFCDEPSAWSPQAGRRLFDSMRTALGKRKCQIVLCGTIAPAPSSGAGSWWPDLVMAGSGKGVHVELVQGRFDSWKDWAEVLKANPACAVNPYLEKTLRREFEEALKSERAAIPFRQYRLNLPGGESTGEQPLITLAEWQRVCARPVPACEGNPVIGIDLGGTRSWSAACALWPSGRISSWAIAPGQPSLADQEREDQVPEDSYTSLVRSGGLAVDEGRAVPDIEVLLARVWAWSPSCIVCDPFRSKELHQVIAGRTRIVERARGGGESTSNVQSLRSLLLDSSAGVTLNSRALLEAAFMQTNLVIDNSGVTRVSKVDRRRSRDDAAAALLLAAGEQARRPAPVELRGAIISREGLVTWI